MPLFWVQWAWLAGVKAPFHPSPETPADVREITESLTRRVSFREGADKSPGRRSQESWLSQRTVRKTRIRRKGTKKKNNALSCTTVRKPPLERWKCHFTACQLCPTGSARLSSVLIWVCSCRNVEPSPKGNRNPIMQETRYCQNSCSWAWLQGTLVWRQTEKKPVPP